MLHTVSVFLGKTSIQQDLTNLWTLEALGIKDPDGEEFTVAEQQAVDHFDKTTIFASDRYEVSLPFKVTPPKLENSHAQAFD